MCVEKPSDAHMHLMHYFVGLAFYCGTGVAIVAESPFVAAASSAGMARYCHFRRFRMS